MILYWLIYFLLSFCISYLLSLLFDNKISKIICFGLSFSLMSAIWFRIPGENIIAPIISIFLLESTILDNNGIGRILRPFVFWTFFIAIFALLLFKNKTKN